MGIESEPSVVGESGGNERTGGAQGGINETRAHSCRQRNKEEELGVEMG